VGMVRWVIGVSGLSIRVDTERDGGRVRQGLRGAGVRWEMRGLMIRCLRKIGLLGEGGVSKLERMVGNGG
jgi:hypothetical protein